MRGGLLVAYRMRMSTQTIVNSLVKTVVRWTIRGVVALLVLVAVGLLWLFRDALHDRYVLFPKQEAAWDALRAQRQDVTLDDGYYDVRGVCHSHSKISHDSEMEWEAILAAAKKADIQFLFMSDHNINTKADFSWQWRGEHDGVYFYPGFELGAGFLVWGLAPDVVLSDTLDKRLLAKMIVEKGGMFFFAHSEEERMWDLPEVSGMEIYNIHTDFKDENYIDVLPGMMLNTGRYPDLTIRKIYDRHDDIIAHWDELNKTRKMIGIGAVDAHKNIGVRLICTSDERLILCDTSPKIDKGQDVSWLPRWLVRMVFGEIVPGKTIWQIDWDPYERSLRYDNNHLLIKETNEQTIYDALKAGRNYVAFDMICDATGFTFMASANGTVAAVGEAMPFAPGTKLTVASPLPGRATIYRDGTQVHQSEGRTMEFTADSPGKYRVMFEVNILDEWTPWVYTNPIELTGGQ